jgi:hypothetical protein
MGCLHYGSGPQSSAHQYLEDQDFLSGFTPLAFEVSLHHRQQFPFHPRKNGYPFRHIFRTIGFLLCHLCLCRNSGKGPLQGSTSRSQLGQGFLNRCYSSITPQFVLACDRQSLASQYWTQVGRVLFLIQHYHCTTTEKNPIYKYKHTVHITHVQTNCGQIN